MAFLAVVFSFSSLKHRDIEILRVLAAYLNSALNLESLLRPLE